MSAPTSPPDRAPHRRTGRTDLARRGFYGSVLVVGASLVVALLLQQLGWTRSDGEITRLDVAATFGTDGVLAVREDTALRFRAAQAGPNVERLLPAYASLPDGRVRETPVRDIRLEDGAGHAVPFHVDRLPRDVRLRFALPGVESSAVRSYVLSYRVQGLATARGDQTVMARDLAGNGFGLPVDRVSMRVDGGTVASAACLTGPPSARRFCADVTAGGAADPGVARFGDRNLGATDALAVEVRYSPPILGLSTERATAAPTAYGTNLLRRLGLGLLVLALAGAVATLWQRSTPRARRGVEEPPFGMRPGEAGVLVAGEGASRHLGATLLDLVRRGFVELSGVPGRDPDDAVVLRQKRVDVQRDELALHEWSLMLKVFRREPEVRLSDVRRSARRWSWELLRELERQMRENRWRNGPSTARLQRLGCLAAMVAGAVAYAGVGLLSITRWPDLPVRDLVLAALVAVLWCAGCAVVLARIPGDGLSARGRWAYASAAGFAASIRRRGVDEDEPNRGIWAASFGLRPDVIDLPVVEPARRRPVRTQDRSADGMDGAFEEYDDELDSDGHEDRDDRDDRDDGGESADQAYADQAFARSGEFGDEDVDTVVGVEEITRYDPGRDVESVMTEPDEFLDDQFETDELDWDDLDGEEWDGEETEEPEETAAEDEDPARAVEGRAGHVSERREAVRGLGRRSGRGSGRHSGRGGAGSARAAGSADPEPAGSAGPEPAGSADSDPDGSGPEVGSAARGAYAGRLFDEND